MSAIELQYIPLPTALPLSGSTAEVHRVAKSGDGFPCRRCQANSSAGDVMRLISYNPFDDTEGGRMSPYSAPGPIFVHDKECITYAGSELAESHRPRTFSVRGYDASHMTVDVRQVNGKEVDERAKEMFENKDLQYIHAYNTLHGCFAFKIARAA